MASSLTKLYAHLVFSTKGRKPLIDEAIRPRVHGCVASVLRSMHCPYVVVGGVADHVHIAFQLAKDHAPAELVKEIKVESSKFVKTLGNKYRDFFWQRGYAMFSVGPVQQHDLEKYVRGQEQHHRTCSFQEEFRLFLQKYNIEYDERYIWD